MWPNLRLLDRMVTLELCNSQPIRTKPNICIYLESIRVALSYQTQKHLISFKRYEQCHSTENTYFCPRIENIRTRSLLQLLQPDEESCRSEILHASVYGLELSKGIARAEIFFAGLKKNLVRTDGSRTLVAYSIVIHPMPDCVMALLSTTTIDTIVCGTVIGGGKGGLGG